MKRRILFMLTFLLLAACGGDPAPELLPTPTPNNVAAVASPTTAVSSSTGAAINTPLPPPPTLAAVSTSTPLPQTPTPSATATSEPIFLQEASDFGQTYNPLTGERITDPTVLERRPFIVKLSNSPASYTRPQSGLNEADLIFEHTTEGNITRFSAIFYGKTPPKVGPIRSARLIDIELPAMYNAALFYSGTSTGVGQRMRRSDIRGQLMPNVAGVGYYRTGEEKPFEHTLYGTPATFWNAMSERDLIGPPTFNTYMAFSDATPTGGQPASSLTIDHRWTLIEWRYDAEIGRYRRWSDDVEHLDGNTGEQVTAANVIVISPNHALDANICEQITNGECDHLSVEVQLWGSGQGRIFRDGQEFIVTWLREGRNDMLTFTDDDGNPFPLQIGNSWVQVVPNWLSDPLSVTR